MARKWQNWAWKEACDVLSLFGVYGRLDLIHHPPAMSVELTLVGLTEISESPVSSGNDTREKQQLK
jgi:hypothetical protein